MKKNLFPMMAITALVGMAACNNGAETTTTDTTTTSESSTMGTTESNASTTVSFDENASYVDLESGKPVKLRKDATSGYVTKQDDNTPIMWYYNPATNDTFNREGMVVNNYLMRSPSGTYTLDEDKWKTKTDEDGDFKAKDGEGNKIKVDGNEPEVKIKTADGTKEKIDENSYKSKGPDGKIKVKDDKMKEKPNN